MDINNKLNYNGCMYTAVGKMVCDVSKTKSREGVEGFACVNPTSACTAAQIDAWLASPTVEQCCVVKNDIPLMTAFSSGKPMCTTENNDKLCTSFGYTPTQLRDFVMAARTDGKTEKACCKLVI